MDYLYVVRFIVSDVIILCIVEAAFYKVTMSKVSLNCKECNIRKLCLTSQLEIIILCIIIIIALFGSCP